MEPTYTGEYLCDITDESNLTKLKNAAKRFLGGDNVDDNLLKDVLLENNNDLKKSILFIGDVLLVSDSTGVSHSKAKTTILTNGGDVLKTITELKDYEKYFVKI